MQHLLADLDDAARARELAQRLGIVGGEVDRRQVLFDLKNYRRTLNPSGFISLSDAGLQITNNQ